jgi:hypothetical protein
VIETRSVLCGITVLSFVSMSIAVGVPLVRSQVILNVESADCPGAAKCVSFFYDWQADPALARGGGGGG